MQQLQRRLAETEQQMSLILEAMQGVQAGVTSVVSSTGPQDIDDGARTVSVKCIDHRIGGGYRIYSGLSLNHI